MFEKFIAQRDSWYPSERKTAFLSFVIGICLVGGLYLFGLGDIVEQFVSNPILSSFPEEVRTIPAIHLTLLTFFAIIILWGTSRNMRPIQRGIVRFWPDPPFFLDAELEKPNAETFDAYAEDQIFVGRETELSILNRFSDDPARRQSWAVLTGRMGRGKTRLALEWLKQLSERDKERWDVGVWRDNLTFEQMQNGRLRRATAIIIDDASRLDPDIVWKNIVWLMRQGTKRSYPVRILLVDQWAPKETIGFSSKAEDRKFLSDKKARLSKAHNGNQYRLSQLGEAAALALGEANGLDIRAVQKAEGRALLLKLGHKPWDEIARRAEKRLRDAKNSDEKFVLALSALSRGLLDKDGPKRVSNIKIRRRLALFEGSDKGQLAHYIPDLRPKILAQEILLQWTADASDAELESLFESGLNISANSVRRSLDDLIAERMTRIRGDENATTFSKTPEFARLVALRPERWKADVRLEIQALHDQQVSLLSRGDFEECLVIQDKIRHYAAAWSTHDDINTLYSAVLSNIIHKAHGGFQPVALSAIVSELRACTETHINNRDIAINYSDGLVSATNYLGQLAPTDNVWDEFVQMNKDLETLSQRWPGCTQIIIDRAKALVNTTLYLSRRKDDFSDLEECLDMLRSIANAHPETKNIDYQLVKGLANATNWHTQQVSTPDSLRAFALRVEEAKVLSEQWPNSSELAAEYTKSLVNQTSIYSGGEFKNRDREPLYSGLSKVKFIYEKYPQSQDISLQYLRSLVNESRVLNKNPIDSHLLHRLNDIIAQSKRLLDAHNYPENFVLEYSKIIENVAAIKGRFAYFPDSWPHLIREIEALRYMVQKFPVGSDMRLHCTRAYNSALKALPAEYIFRESIVSSLAQLARASAFNSRVQSFLSQARPKLAYVAQHNANWPYGTGHSDRLTDRS